MKNFFFASFSFGVLATSQALAHDIHHVASDHFHYPNYLYTHSVSSHYDHHQNHHYNNHYNTTHNRLQHDCERLNCVTNTATYYTREYPVTKSYTYYRPANTTIHQPPYAYSSCAGRCQDAEPKRVSVTSKLGARTYTYRAPSEYNANQNVIRTPRPQPCNNRYHSTSRTYVSPYQTHKLNTCTSRGCHY